jgi:hypothetical protein
VLGLLVIQIQLVSKIRLNIAMSRNTELYNNDNVVPSSQDQALHCSGDSESNFVSWSNSWVEFAERIEKQNLLKLQDSNSVQVAGPS